MTGLPPGLVHLRTTPEFDERSVPAGLLAAHRIAEGVWGLLRVRAGTLDFVVEDGSTPPRRLRPGDTQVIPEMVKIATFYDPDGNTLMLFEDLSGQNAG